MTTHFINSSVDCPMCKSKVSFRSVTANMLVCSICNTAMERFESGTINTISLSVAKKDVPLGVLQVGTRGVYTDFSFELIGCLHCNFEDYSSRRWTVLWADNTTGLLVETLGFYAFYKKVEPDFASKLPTVRQTPVGGERMELLRGKHTLVFDKSFCDSVWLEGEVSWMDRDGIFHTVELGALNGGGRLELVDLGKNVFELFQVDYVGLHELALTNLHPAALPKNLPCAKCGKPVTVRLPHHSRHCICSHCNTWNELEPGKNAFQPNKKKISPYTFALPIGSKAIIDGNDYILTGATVKNETGESDVFWREYTLYDAITGYAFLAEYNGHWSFLKETKLNCDWPQFDNTVYFDGEKFELFNDYEFNVRSAAGEFFTTLHTVGFNAREYIAPPNMYAAELNKGKDLAWYKARYMSEAELSASFVGMVPVLTYKTGVGPLQPLKHTIQTRLLLRMCGIFFLLFFAVQVFFELTARRENLFQASFDVPDSLLSRGITTSSFELKPSKSNLDFLISSPVDNNWFEASMTLVNEKSGQEYAVEKGVEYYHGYSDGESWSEGSTEAEAGLSSIPAGRYHLNIFPAAPAGSPGTHFAVSVINDTPIWSNFFLVLGMLGLYPLLVWWRNQTFEKRRWNNTPYNPYQKDDE